jgi:6-hydroxytryprostatin B O-methyltransferase
MPSSLENGNSDNSSPLEELSLTITHNANIVSQYLKANDLPQPSFNSDGPAVVVPKNSPQTVIKAQQELIAAALEISQLAIGPSEFLPNLALGVSSQQIFVRIY